MPDLQVCLQVNVSGEASKAASAGRNPALAAAVAALPRLSLRGLMCIPEATDDLPRLREQLAVLPQLRAQLAEQGLALDTLSMGMSADLELAVACGFDPGARGHRHFWWPHAASPCLTFTHRNSLS